MPAEQDKDNPSIAAADRAGNEDAEAGAPQDLAGVASGQADPATDDPDPAADDEVATLRDDLQDAREQVLRVQAEMQNIHRRAERDVENAHKFALDKFASALLPVLDNLERALAAIDPENEHTRSLVEGIELTQRSFVDVLRRFQIEVIDPVGEPFDPARHEAITTVENDEVEPNTVLTVIQKGYTLNGRVLRAAMVMVARPGAAARVDETA